MLTRALPPDGFSIIGHRGALGLAPENTLASFRAAVRHRVDGVELDVRLAGGEGGELVVFHDDRVDRTTDGSGPLAAFTLAALRALDAGDGERIPTLAEVLDAVPEHIAVNVELKGERTACPTARQLAGLKRPLLVSSHDHDELAAFHAACPAVPCAPLVRRWRSGLEATARALDAWAVTLADRVVSRRRVARVRSWGCGCYVYTVNEPDRARRLRDLGATGVFTDFPDRLRSCGLR